MFFAFRNSRLKLGRLGSCNSKEVHDEAKKGKGVCSNGLSYELRRAAREWGMAKPELADLFSFERLQWPGEDIEPLRQP
jgi:hypothetical protein